jgi:hypothetical protein
LYQQTPSTPSNQKPSGASSGINFCKTCNTPLLPNAKFCANCGTKVTNPKEQDSLW